MEHQTAHFTSGFVARFKLISLCMAALMQISAADADTAPLRVVSMNLCTDQLAMMLADEGQLISVSDIASDPNMSPMAEQARAYRVNHGQAEEIFLMRPDLVVAGRYSDPVVLDMLRRLGIPTAQLDIVSSLDQVGDRIREMGALLHQTTRAEAVARAFEADLAALNSAAEGPRAAFYYPNSYSLGTGTLSHEIVTTAGFRHIAEEMRRSRSGRLDLELLALAQPDLLIHAELYGGASRSEEVMSHPALAALGAARTQSNAHWVCGTPVVLRAIHDLRDLRERMDG